MIETEFDPENSPPSRRKNTQSRRATAGSTRAATQAGISAARTQSTNAIPQIETKSAATIFEGMLDRK
jgi:hypothetical protein